MKASDIDISQPDGYKSIKLIFSSYFEFQPIVGDKKSKEDYKRTLRQIETECKVMNGH